MSDFLDRMASRSQGAAPVLRPRPLSLFEGGPELFEEVHLETEAPPPSRADAPPRTTRRVADPASPRPPAETWRDPAPEPWPEAAAPSRPPPPGAFSRPRLDRAESVEDPFPPAPDRVAAAAPGTAPAPDGPMPAATVQRRAAGAPVAAAADPGQAGPLPRVIGTAGRDADPESPTAAPARFPELPRIEEARRADPIAGRVSGAAISPAETAAGRVEREAAPAPAPAAASPARAVEPAPRGVPPRTGVAVEALAPTAVPANFGGHPFAPRAETAPAPAPIEIRIGRIDIHAAPPAVPAAPAEAPGPSLDAFLARPRR